MPKQLEGQGIQSPCAPEDIEPDPELERTILGARQDIANGHVYTTDEIFAGIERGEV